MLYEKSTLGIKKEKQLHHKGLKVAAEIIFLTSLVLGFLDRNHLN